LREAAASVRTGFVIGVGGLAAERLNDPRAKAVMAQHFNAATAGNACKYTSIQRAKGKYYWDDCDAIRSLATDTMQGKFRLHALAWGNQNKPWLFQLTASEKRQNMIESIREVVTHYGSDSWAIDVVNEAVTDDVVGAPLEPLHAAEQTEHLKAYANLGGLQSGRGPHPWYPSLPDYVDFAFTESRRHCARCKLFYNDYNAEGSGGPNYLKVKSDRVYEVIKGMLSRKVPVDGVGLQFHIHLERERRPSVAGIKANIQRFADLGVEIHITEADIKVPPPWTPAKELEQAKLYAEVLEACWSIPKCTAFIVWGLRDADSWLLKRANVVNPLLFDDDYKAKLAVPYMVHVLQGRGVTWQSVDFQRRLSLGTQSANDAEPLPTSFRQRMPFLVANRSDTFLTLV
jgi:endo-1,4-beta-xylanase